MSGSTLERRKELEANCPEGYAYAVPGQFVNMLDKTELWIIYSNHAEPHLTRIPQDLVDSEWDHPCAARVPKDWGYPLYYKVI